MTSASPLSNRIFEYEVIAHPHLTDYSGDLWHGAYIRWLEEARIEAFRQVGLDYATLVNLGCGLPVVDLSVKYVRPIGLGHAAMVSSSLLRHDKIRIVLRQIIYGLNPKQKAVEATVTLVPVSTTEKRILRHSPPELKAAIARIQGLPEP